MARSVRLKAALPSLKQFGRMLGLTKARQNSLISIIKSDPAVASRGEGTQAPPKHAVKAGARSSSPKKAARATSR